MVYKSLFDRELNRLVAIIETYPYIKLRRVLMVISLMWLAGRRHIIHLDLSYVAKNREAVLVRAHDERGVCIRPF